MKIMLPDVIGHENQSQHYQHHRYLCLDLSGHRGLEFKKWTE